MAKPRYFLTVDDHVPVSQATVYGLGAVVNGTQSNVTTVLVHAPHDIQIGDKFVYALTRQNVQMSRIFTCTSRNATHISFAGAASFPDKALLVNLEADTVSARSDGSWPNPNFDGSGETIYSDPNGDTTLASATVSIDPGGEVGWYGSGSTVWVVMRDTNGRAVRIYPSVGAFPQATGLTLPSPTTDNAIVRWDGTGGTAVQDYTSNAPTISDAGAVVIPSTLRADGDVDFNGAMDLAGAAALHGAVTASSTMKVAGVANFAAGPVFDVKHPAFGAVGDGTTDDAAAINAAIVAANAAGGGIVFFPSGAYAIDSVITLLQSVELRGCQNNMNSLADSAAGGTVIKAGSGWSGAVMLKAFDALGFTNVTIRHMRIVGSSGVTNIINLDSTRRCTLEDLYLDTCQKSAILLNRTGAAGTGEHTMMREINVVNAVLGSSLADFTGAIHLNHTDSFLSHCRASCSVGTTYTESGKRCGLYIGSVGNFVMNSYFDFNETGVYIGASQNQLACVRADWSSGHGFVLPSGVTTGSANGCQALNSGQATTNTYDGFNVTCSRFAFVGCTVALNGTATLAKYGFNQQSAFGADNRYVACTVQPTAVGTAAFLDAHAAGGWETRNSYAVAGIDDATPTVLNIRTLSTGGNNTTTTAVTQLDDGIPNQTVRVFCADNTHPSTIANGGNFVLTGGDWIPKNNDWIELFTFTGSVWHEITRSAKTFGAISLIDGVTAPATVSGRTAFYVDTSDGDAKLRFGDGAIVVIPDVAGTVLSDSVAATVKADYTFGDASTDVYTFAGRMVIRSVAADPTGTGTAGTRGELVRFNDVLYIKTTGDGTDTNWAKVGAQ